MCVFCNCTLFHPRSPRYSITILVSLLIAGVLIALFVVAMVWKMSRSRLLSGANLRAVEESWKRVEAMQNATLQIMDADKVLDLALTKLGFTGNLGEKLKKAGPRFRDSNAVWSAHKLRNTLAHEMNASVSPDQSSRAMRAFRQALKDLGMA